MTQKAPICILALAIEERPRFIGELERLTEVLYTAIPAPSDCEEKSQWDHCFVVAGQVECSPIVMYDSGDGEDLSLTKDVQWRARVCDDRMPAGVTGRVQTPSYHQQVLHRAANP